jgi:hypothetical protein
MKEALMPIVLVAGAVILAGLALLMPMIIYAAYKDLIKGGNK